ncbi:alpha/beta hydrolase [uncultured Flavobacterium sp.]|uniref:alpha/beta hydrolase n=1 Tax=uncultured Flavobacterium sp. TaxID=165435 RepID=UPI0025E6BED1|nr:alpha/beta hydrolase [uncultured Flavobacterium sp.]
MKKEQNLLPIQLFFSINNTNSTPTQVLLDVSYGTDPEQRMDVYLPARRNEATKVFILLHGGGWSGGSKDRLNYLVPLLRDEFPGHAIINMDYRLASFESPAFPKQLQDIETAIAFIEESDYDIGNQYAFIGLSAGAHLAMLYSYAHDPHRNIKALCSVVGPADFTDPFYVSHPYYQYAAMYLLGHSKSHPEAVLGISPLNFVNPQSPATILFYGGKDPLVPQSQAERLKAKLDASNVYSEYYLYPEGGHSKWETSIADNFRQKLVAFLKARF